MADARQDSVVGRFVLVSLVAPAVFTAVTLGLLFAWRADLPQPIAIHWGAGGEPNGYGPLATVVVLSLVLGLAVPALLAATSLPMLIKGARGSGFRLMGSVAAGVSVLSAVLNTWSVGMQRGIADAHDGPSVFPALACGFGAALVAGVAAWYVQPRQETVIQGFQPGVPLALGSNERVVWMRTATFARPFAIMLYVAVFSLGMGTVALWLAGEEGAAWLYLGIAIFVALALAATSAFHVKVDQTGLSIVSVLGVPRWHVALNDVLEVGVAPVNGLSEFGGWGVRLRPGALGIVLRNGESLQVTRRSGSRIVITVDDAATAAALLTAFAAQQSGASQVTARADE